MMMMMSSPSPMAKVNLRVEGNRLKFMRGGFLQIRFQRISQIFYHSMEEETVMIGQTQQVGTPDSSLVSIPTNALTSPRLIKQYLVHTSVGNNIHLQTQETLNVLALDVASVATQLLMTGPPPSSYSGGLFLCADVEVFTWEIVYRGEVVVESLQCRGASKKAVMKLKREDGFQGDGDCVVCLDELSSGRKVTQMPCDHVFHHSCLLRWLKNSDSCPICRRQLGNN